MLSVVCVTLAEKAREIKRSVLFLKIVRQVGADTDESLLMVLEVLDIKTQE